MDTQERRNFAHNCVIHYLYFTTYYTPDYNVNGKTNQGVSRFKGELEASGLVRKSSPGSNIFYDRCRRKRGEFYLPGYPQYLRERGNWSQEDCAAIADIVSKILRVGKYEPPQKNDIKSKPNSTLHASVKLAC